MSSIPAIIGKYEIVSELGSGAMGVVYKARDNIDRTVALKTLGGQAIGSGGDDMRLRFRTEAVAAAKLGHHNIVRIYEYSEHEGQPFIAMEYVEGCTLSDLIGNGQKLEPDEMCRIILNVLDGLHYAHECGVVHRDIKPANIMIDQGGEVKIADFGIARIENSTQTVVGTVMGTAGYMPPEQIRGEQVDRRADIFPVGVMLFELLTAVRAFEGNSFHETSSKVISDELPPVSRLCPGINKGIDPIVAKAVAKAPADRFQTAAEFANALQNLEVPICGQIDTETILRIGAAGRKQAPPANAALSGQPQQEPAGRGSAGKETVIESPASQPAGGRGKVSAEKAAQYGRFAAIALGVLVIGVAGAYLASGMIPANGQDADLLAAVDAPTVTAEPAEAESPATEGAFAGNDVETTADPGPVLEYPIGEQFSDCDFCPEIRVLQPGSFTQGVSVGEQGSEPRAEQLRTVTITRPLGVGVNEVTRGQFARFVEETGYKATGCTTYDGEWTEQTGQGWLTPGFEQDDNHPVTCVSWADAKAYTQWLTGKTDKQYRLLSESEWEYVARAGTTTVRSWGDSPDAACASANVADRSAKQDYSDWEVHACNDRFTHTAPAGQFAANAFGVNDMLGNVFEWVEDCWKETYDPAVVDGSAVTFGDCERRVLRGGSWYTRPDFVRSAARNHFPPDHRSSAFGFRVARELGSG